MRFGPIELMALSQIELFRLIRKYMQAHRLIASASEEKNKRKIAGNANEIIQN